MGRGVTRAAVRCTGLDKMKRFETVVLLLCLSGCTTAEPSAYAPRLLLVDIAIIPFSLGFDDESDFPIGTNRNGFVAVRFVPKGEKKQLPSGDWTTVDVSELILKRGDRLVTLVKGRRVPYEEHAVHLIDESSGKEYGLRTGEKTMIGSRRLRLRGVNVKEQSCTLEDAKSGEQFTINRTARPESGHVGK